jgi:hypothetical protein
MQLPPVNYLAVLTSAVVIFLLGGLWYSPVLFARKWMSLMGKTEAELKADSSGSMPLMYLLAFICGLLTSWVLAVLLNHFLDLTALRGAMVGALCWVGFAAPTSFATTLFSGTPKRLWLINSTYNLISFILAGIILAVWR